MKRQDKYPDTKWFHYFNANPKNRMTTDCVYRAICTGLNIPYNTVVREMAEMQCETGYDNGDNKLIDRYLKSKGWVKCNQPRKSDNTKFTGKDFCKYTREKRVVANIGGHHIVAIIDNKINDIWDSSDGCIGNYWVPEEV